jgi:hypothetical protein
LSKAELDRHQDSFSAAASVVKQNLSQ